MTPRLTIPCALLLVGCQTPFGTDRHDLVADRVAGIVVQRPDDATVQPRALLVSRGALWADEATELAWGWLDAEDPDVDAWDPADAVATGPLPVLELPEGASVLGLVATFPSGTEWRAILPMAPGGPTPVRAPDGLATFTLPGLSPTTATPEELAREARLEREVRPADWLFPTRWSRFALSWTGAAPEAVARTRWMSSDGRGTFLELDDTRTDWAPAELVLDGTEIDEATATPEGLVSVLALVLDDEAVGAAFTTEVWLGEPAADGLWLAHRWVATDAQPDAPYVRGTLVADDDAPTGLALTDVVGLVADDLPDDDPFGTEVLPCEPGLTGPFDPTWLLDQRCLRDDLVGAVVVAEVLR